MRKINLIKTVIVLVVLTFGLVGFLFTRKSETQTINSAKTPDKILNEINEIADYKKWTKINDKPQIMPPIISASCARATPSQIEAETNNPHIEKYINVYVNPLGKDEMLKKKKPKFPVGTIVVKEKLSSPESDGPELLTVMIKREKGFNPEVGDWEFITYNGEGTKVTSRGKLQNCQTCHVGYKATDFITRTYLPENVRQTLK